MIKVIVHDNNDKARRVVYVHSVGHATTDICIGVTALISAFAAFMAQAEHDRPDDICVQIKRGDGEFQVTAIGTDCWDHGFHKMIEGAVAILMGGLANYQAHENSGVAITFSNERKTLDLWRDTYHKCDCLQPVMAVAYEPEPLPFE